MNLHYIFSTEKLILKTCRWKIPYNSPIDIIHKYLYTSIDDFEEYSKKEEVIKYANIFYEFCISDNSLCFKYDPIILAISCIFVTFFLFDSNLPDYHIENCLCKYRSFINTNFKDKEYLIYDCCTKLKDNFYKDNQNDNTNENNINDNDYNINTSYDTNNIKMTDYFNNVYSFITLDNNLYITSLNSNSTSSSDSVSPPFLNKKRFFQ